MNKKKLIQIIIIIVGLTASAVILYNGFFKSNGAPATPSAGQPSAPGLGVNSDKLLPYGTSLNFDVLDKHNLQFGAVTYPQLDPASDVGVLPDHLLQPLPKPPAGPGK